jgi:3-hydroxyisobutyrate dehydrogenase-like beta-hydroxyacid dehydrogenase
VLLGFVGLGQMGRPIALNLVRGGADVLVHARHERRFEELRSVGARATTDVTDLADVAVLFLCLPGSAAVESFMFGAGGELLAPLRRGAAVVDLGTTAYGATIRAADALQAKGIQFMDAPVSGMEARAVQGTLTVMCGGEEEVYGRVRPYLDLIGSTVLHIGPVGSGQLTKLVNQLLFDINAAALAEVLPMAARLGLDPDLVGQVVNSGTGRSHASQFFVPRILRGHFTDGYPMKDAYKDLVNAAEMTAGRGIPMPVLAAATATYQTALLRGHGDQDKGAMVRVFEELLDVEFRSGSQTHADEEST